MSQRPYLAYADDACSNETDKEHHAAQKTEDVHRLLAKGGEEPQGDEVQVAVNETVPTHEF